MVRHRHPCKERAISAEGTSQPHRSFQSALPQDKLLPRSRLPYQERTNRKPACRQSAIFLWGHPILALPLLREALSLAPPPATQRCPPSTLRGSSTSPSPRGLSPCRR